MAPLTDMYLSSQMAERSFAAIDQNNDGFLSIDEFVNVAIDFLYSEDESSVGKDFFGVLVDELPDTVRQINPQQVSSG